MKDVIPPSLPLPAPHAMRKGRAVRVRLFTPRQRRLIVALLAVTVVALCVVLR